MFDNYRDKKKRKEYSRVWRGKTKDKQKGWHKDWMAKNGEGFREYQKEWYKSKAEYLRELRLKNKELVYSHYGNKCNCCKETEKKFLTIDHVNNDGYKDKKDRGGSSDSLYRKIIKENFPDIYQILCYNCNCGKARNNGICPHNDIDLN